MKIQKIRTLSIYPILLLFCILILGLGCEKEENTIWEISPDSGTTVIQTMVDGIEFKFCLLNEAGEAATVFNEGENFTFQFSFKNLKNDDIVVSTEFISEDFYRVTKKSSTGLIDMGRPWTGVWCELSMAPHVIMLEPGQKKQINCPWVLTEDNMVNYPLCVGESKEALKKGEYITSFILDFHYTINSKNKNIDDITFSIKFKIQ